MEPQLQARKIRSRRSHDMYIVCTRQLQPRATVSQQPPDLTRAPLARCPPAQCQRLQGRVGEQLLPVLQLCWRCCDNGDFGRSDVSSAVHTARYARACVQATYRRPQGAVQQRHSDGTRSRCRDRSEAGSGNKNELSNESLHEPSLQQRSPLRYNPSAANQRPWRSRMAARLLAGAMVRSRRAAPLREAAPAIHVPKRSKQGRNARCSATISRQASRGSRTYP